MIARIQQSVSRIHPGICLKRSGTLRKPLWGYPASWPRRQPGISRIRSRTAIHSAVMLGAAVITPATHNTSSRTHCEYCYRTTLRITEDSTLQSPLWEPQIQLSLITSSPADVTATEPKSLSNEPNFAAHIASRDTLPHPHVSNSLLAFLNSARLIGSENRERECRHPPQQREATLKDFTLSRIMLRSYSPN
jgi:hypothetical protein